MNNLQTEIIEYARTWLGTPYRDNQASLGMGVDCVQFARVTCEHVGIPQVVYENYYRTPIRDELLKIFQAHPNFEEIPQIEPACVMVFRLSGKPHHIAIATSETTMIHTDFRNGVVEHGIGNWTDRCLAYFRVLV